jgi:hypothetical protein
MRRARLRRALAEAGPRSRIGTIVPRRLMTPRTNDGVFGSWVATCQARISRTSWMSMP